MLLLATIIQVRDHPTHPIKLDLDVGDGALEIGWTMVCVSAWGTVKFSDLKPDVQVAVWDTGFVGGDDKYRVLAIFPTAELTLPNNRAGVARVGDPVAISGASKLTPAAAGTILSGVPPIFPLGHDLKGRILGDG